MHNSYINYMEIYHPVFLMGGEEWVANQGMILTSIPPQYNVYRLSDKCHGYMFVGDVQSREVVRYISNSELYYLLNPDAKILQSSVSSGVLTIASGGDSGILTSIDGGLTFSTTIDDIKGKSNERKTKKKRKKKS